LQTTKTIFNLNVKQTTKLVVIVGNSGAG